ncbi:lytic transglycosylase domain-containing protein [Paenibacillus marinisediminis]
MSNVKNKLLRKRYLLVLLVGLLFILFVQSQWLGKWMYPIPYEDTIRENAEAYQVDPFLVASVIRVESNYRPGQESRKGAIGMMQLMPDTATWIMGQMKVKDQWTLEQLKYEAEPNIMLGTWYLNSLIKQFDNNWIAAVAAYNAGPGNVSQWLRDDVWDGRLETASQQIPFNETRLYVQRVFHYYDKYKKAYE